MIPFVKAEWGRRQARRRLLHISPVDAAWAHRAGRHLLEGIRSLPVESRVASPTWECGWLPFLSPPGARRLLRHERFVAVRSVAPARGRMRGDLLVLAGLAAFVCGVYLVVVVGVGLLVAGWSHPARCCPWRHHDRRG